MIAAKAVAAVLMTGLGSLAAGTAAYLESNPRTFTSEHRELRSPPAPVVPARPLVVHEPASTESVVVVDPVLIVGRERKPAKAIAKPPRPSVDGPCSDWQTLATGPDGRKVRMLCPH